MQHFTFSIPYLKRIQISTEYYCPNSYFVCVYRPVRIEILKERFLIPGKVSLKNHFRKNFNNFTFSE